MISCQLDLDKTDRGISWLLHSPGFGFFVFSALLSEAHDHLSSLKGHSCGVGTCALQSISKLLAWCLGLFAFWTISPHSLVSAELPSQAAARGAERVQSLPTSQTHRQPPCPCSDWHIPLSGTQWEPSGCFNSEHGQGKDRKRTENWKAAKDGPFFSLLIPFVSVVLEFCLSACLFISAGKLRGHRAVGPGLCGCQQVFHRHCVSRSHFMTAMAAEPAQTAFSPSICFQWLELAFFPVSSFSGMPVNTS